MIEAYSEYIKFEKHRYTRIMEEIDKMMEECEQWENEGVQLYDPETRKLMMTA